MANTSEACTLLSSLLEGKVAYPGNPKYKAVEDAYFCAQEEELLPACIVTPICTDDVAVAVKALAKLQVKFAIRGGGHNLNAGAANIDSGITINLRSMKNVTLNADKTMVSIGGGAKWADVYVHLDGSGVATSGGRVADVGVGGLTTGGGISFFSAREGLVCDNVENFEVVLSSGEIVNANQDQNTDLWIALKGGSSNFGIVTRFDIRTFPQADFYGGLLITSIASVSEQLNGFANLLANFDPYVAIIMSITWNQTRNDFTVYNNLEYTKPIENPPAFQAFTQAQSQYMNTMRISTLHDFATEAGKFALAGLRNQYATTTFGGDLSVLKTVYDIWTSSLPPLASFQDMNWAMSIQPLPPAFSRSTARLGGNSLCLDPSSGKGSLTLFLLSYSWSNATNDKAVISAAQKLIADIDAATKERGVFNKFKYLNYAANWQRPMEGYGEESVQRLKAVSAKYDPEGLFQKNVPGGFKVSEIG